MTYQPPQPGYQQQQPYPPPGYYQQPARIVTRVGLPVWMHVLYFTLGWIPCFLGWIVWPIHAWFAHKKSVTHTHMG